MEKPRFGGYSGEGLHFLTWKGVESPPKHLRKQKWPAYLLTARLFCPGPVQGFEEQEAPEKGLGLDWGVGCPHLPPSTTLSLRAFDHPMPDPIVQRH